MQLALGQLRQPAVQDRLEAEQNGGDYGAGCRNEWEAEGGK
jgi:hypothetical protein